MSALPSIEIPKRSKRAHPVVVRTPFDRGFITAFKARVPHAGRTWDEEKRVWRVSREHRRDAEEVMLAHWPEIQVYGDPEEGDYILTSQGEIISQPSLF